MDGRHPEVGGAGVKDHIELLARSADGDLAIVLSLRRRGKKEKRREMGSRGRK